MTTALSAKSDLIVLSHEIKQLIDAEAWVNLNDKIWLLHQAYNAILVEVAKERNIDKTTEFVIAKEKEAANKLQQEIEAAQVEAISAVDDKKEWLQIKVKLLQAHLKTVRAHIQHLEEID